MTLIKSEHRLKEKVGKETNQKSRNQIQMLWQNHNSTFGLIGESEVSPILIITPY